MNADFDTEQFAPGMDQLHEEAYPVFYLLIGRWACTDGRTRRPNENLHIAGRYRSRPLRSLPGMDIRPTADRLRKTLFNILCAGNPEALGGSVWLDLYAGTGAVGIEALSRGAAMVYFVESSKPAADWSTNLKSLNINADSRMVPEQRLRKPCRNWRSRARLRLRFSRSSLRHAGQLLPHSDRACRGFEPSATVERCDCRTREKIRSRI